MTSLFGDVRQAFWHHVDSKPGPYAQQSEWEVERRSGCVALMSDRTRCTRLGNVEGWCDFHWERMVTGVADALEDKVLRRVADMNPTACQFTVDQARLRDAMRLLEQADSRVYFIVCEGFVKIGFSRRPEMRLMAIKQSRRAVKKATLCPDGIDLATAELVGDIPGEMNTERAFHRLLGEYRDVGEWFRLTPTVQTTIDFALGKGDPPRAIEKGLRNIIAGTTDRRRDEWRVA